QDQQGHHGEARGLAEDAVAMAEIGKHGRQHIVSRREPFRKVRTCTKAGGVFCAKGGPGDCPQRPLELQFQILWHEATSHPWRSTSEKRPRNCPVRSRTRRFESWWW